MNARDSIENVVVEIGKSIVTDRNVINSTQKLLSTTVNSGVQIAGAAGSALIGASNVASVTSAVSTAGASIGSAAAGVGNAIMGTKIGSTTALLLSTPAGPIIAGTIIVGGLLWWLCSD